MYIYGITIGMDFKDIAKILMSPTGRIISQLLEGDVFTGYKETNQVVNIFDYFTYLPQQLINKYDFQQTPNGNPIYISPLEKFITLFKEREGIEDQKNFNQAFSEFSRSNQTVADKLNYIEQFRDKYQQNDRYALSMYNQLLDTLQEYVVKCSSVNSATLQDLKTLALGAKEMRRLGSIFSLNQGIKTDPEGLVTQMNLIERAIYDESGDTDDLIDIEKFAFDEDYRNQQIKKYEQYKHSFNILEATTITPHFLGYIQTLAIAVREAKASYKFRNSYRLTPLIAKDIKYQDETSIIKGVENYIGDHIRKEWMLQNDVRIYIPKGNYYFTEKGQLSEQPLEEDTVFNIGTDYGAATFRMFMERQVIPDLKQGKIKPGVIFPGIKDNKFIKDLSNDLSTKGISRNASIIYSLPINMLPRTDIDTALLNSYKMEFNKLAKWAYQYELTQYNQNGEYVTGLSPQYSVVDLFTYYAMIANNWKLSENSLVPILSDFQNKGIIEDFHKFEKAYDKYGEDLDYEEIKQSIRPYIIPKSSPYLAYSTYIWARNKITHRNQVMRKMSPDELQEIIETEQDMTGIINGYIFEQSLDTNYFPTGNIESIERTIRIKTKNGENSVFNKIVYNIETGAIIKDKSSIDLSDYTYIIPTIKVNGIKKVDVQRLEMYIKDKLNPC